MIAPPGPPRRTPRRPGAGRTLGLLLAVVAVTVAPARAQEPAAEGLSLDEVVRTTLAASAEVQTAGWEVQAGEGGLQAARGAFDPRMEASVLAERMRQATLGPDGGIAGVRGLQYGLSAERRLGWGATLSPALVFERSGAAALAPGNEATASLGVLLPLLRDRGGGTDAAEVRATRAEVRASTAALQHTRGEVVLRAVLAYWSYAAAARRLEVQRHAEARAERLVEETRVLVQADDRPAVDLIPVRASLASRRATRLSAEQGVTEARRTLAQAMGISPAAFRRLPPPATSLPTVAAAPLPTPDEAVARALRERADVAAARQRRAAARDRLRGARGELLPRLDLSVRVAYRGVESGGELERLVSPFYSEMGGLHARVGVSYGFPLGNHAARGQALQGTAADRRAEIALAERERTVALDAAAAAETLGRAVQELEQFAEALRLHAAALDAETRKFRLGTATAFDVLFAEDALTAATLAELEARRGYAAALAQLRFETGTLVDADGAGVELAGLGAPPS